MLDKEGRTAPSVGGSKEETGGGSEREGGCGEVSVVARVVQNVGITYFKFS
jgi:hypothetical protein